MTVQFNLLPDVKLAFIKARRNKRLVLVGATLAAAACLTILILLLLVVDVLQKKHLKDVNDDIGSYSSQLKRTPDLTKVLTIQNQLKSLPSLEAQKPIASRLFGYLGQVVPAQVNMSSLEIDFDQHSIIFTGTADTLDRINTFVDTLKFTTYSLKDAKDTPKAFSSVVLTNFGVANANDSSNPANGASYTITTSYDQTIFDTAQTVTLVVPPSKITTRSETEQPNSELFKTSPLNNTQTTTH